MSGATVQSGDTLLYLDGVTVSFDGFRALNALSLVLEAGEMRAVIGPNGAGKTTMMDVITGKTRPDAGKVVFGQDTDLTRSTSRRSPRSASGESSRSRPCSSRTPCGTICCWRWPAIAGRASPCGRARPPRRSERIEEILETTRLTEQRQRPRRRRCRTARSSGWRSACCWRRSRNCCWSTSRWPA